MFSGQLAHKLRHDESGQNLVIAALSMVLVVTLMLVMVGDSGWLLSQRRRMQNAADAAALAGARELALGNTDDAVLSRIVEYAVTFNGADAVDARYYPGGEEVGEGAVPEGAT
ncbi:MAG: TadE/TadG family type IV pilus assembly protein, partial [Anaerolineae bacterium]